MTGYHLTLGYTSHGSRDTTPAWTTLVQVVTEWRNRPAAIVMEVLRELPNLSRAEMAEMAEYAQHYREPAVDKTLTIVPPGDEAGQIMQLASGGEPGRRTKERLRRAFCRLVILEMHRRGIEVNLVVA